MMRARAVAPLIIAAIVPDRPGQVNERASDDSRLPERGDLRLAHAEEAREHLIGVLSQRRARVAHAARRGREPGNDRGLRERTHLRRHLDDGFALAIVRVLEDVGHAHDGRVRKVVGAQGLEGLVGRPRVEPGLRHVEELDHVLGAPFMARELGILRQLRLAEHDAEPLEEMLGGGGEHDVVAVPRAEGAARPSRVLDAASLAHHALAPVVRGRVLEDAEGRLVEGGIDPLPFPGGVTMTEGSHHAEGGEEARQVVGIHGGGTRRRPIGGPIQVPRAAEGRGDGGEARALAERARLTESSDARHDQRRPELAEILPAESPGLEDAGPEVLDDHVAHRHEATHNLLPLRRVQIEGDDLLAAIVDGPPVVGAVLGGPEAAEVVALAGELRLDHLGAELGHEGAAERAGHDLRQLEDADARERQGAIGHGEGRILADKWIPSSPRAAVQGNDTPALTPTMVSGLEGQPTTSASYKLSRFSTQAYFGTPKYVARSAKHANLLLHPSENA